MELYPDVVFGEAEEKYLAERGCSERTICFARSSAKAENAINRRLREAYLRGRSEGEGGM